jgi:hypothetical protein
VPRGEVWRGGGRGSLSFVEVRDMVVDDDEVEDEEFVVLTVLEMVVVVAFAVVVMLAIFQFFRLLGYSTHSRPL